MSPKTGLKIQKETSKMLASVRRVGLVLREKGVSLCKSHLDIFLLAKIIIVIGPRIMREIHGW